MTDKVRTSVICINAKKTYNGEIIGETTKKGIVLVATSNVKLFLKAIC